MALRDERQLHVSIYRENCLYPIKEFMQRRRLPCGDTLILTAVQVE